MTEQRTSPEQRQVLRARYTPATAPQCQMCGKPMGTYGIPEGRVRAWLCDDGHGDFYAETIARNVSLAGDPDVLAAVDDADALAGSLVEAARLQVLVDACIDVLDRAMLRSDWNSLRLAGFKVWEMLTGVPEAPAMEGEKR